MYKAVIIDDEIYVRRTLRIVGLWHEHKIEIVGEAADGDEAYRLITKERPDLAIIDMKMPGMDGTGLLMRLKNEGIRLKVIILSGYSDFKFTKHAIEYGVVDYLLKPIDREELNSTLARTVETIRIERETINASMGKLVYKREVDMFVKEQILYSLLRYGKEPDTINNPKAYLTEFVFEEYVTAVVAPSSKFRLTDQGNDGNMLKRVKDAVMKFFEGKSGCEAVSMNDNTGLLSIIMGFGRPERTYNRLKAGEMLDNLMCYLQERDISACKIGVGTFCSEICNICISFKKACDALEYGNILNGIIYYADEIQKNDSAFAGFLDQSIENMGLQFKVGNYKGLCNMPRQYIQEMSRNSYVEVAGLRRLFDKWINTVEEAFKRADIGIEFMDGLKYELLKAMGTYNIKDITAAVEDMINEIMKNIVRNENLLQKNTIVKIREYVDENYCNDISLQSIAQTFYLNKEYISRAYKKKYNINIMTYLRDLKLKKALELLNGDVKVQDVAMAVGFKDFNYFSKIFKSVYGTTPTQYTNLQ